MASRSSLFQGQAASPQLRRARFRGACWVLLAILVTVFWMPRPLAHDLHVNNHIAQGVLCAVVAMALIEVFALAAPSRDVTRKILMVTAAFVIFAAALELGQSLVGRHAAMGDFLVNACSASLAIAVLVGYRRYVAPVLVEGLPAPGAKANRSYPGPAVARTASDRGFPPAAYIIGAQKSATTSLASLLTQHEGITMSSPKEPDFYTTNWAKGPDWYRSRFARHDTCLIEASTSYSMAPCADSPAPTSTNPLIIGVPGRIHQLQPDAKFIYIVRDPAARTFSAYWHYVRQGGETRPLRRAILQGSYYTDPSFYFAQISNYLEYFDLSRFLFLTFDDFVANPIAQAQRCADFLGIAPFTFAPEPPKNESFQYNRLGELTRDLAGRSTLDKISTTVRDLTPAWSHAMLKSLMQRPNPRMNARQHAWLSSFFDRDIENFAKLTGITPLRMPPRGSATPAEDG
jgi:hypothetical protein